MNQRIWAPVEVIRLLNHIKNNRSLEDISKRENRSIQSIQAKLKDVAVDLYFNKNMSYNRVEEITGIQKEEILVKRQKPVVKLSNNPKLNGSPKELQVTQIIPVAHELRLSTENPFSIESLSTLILSSINICLLASKS